MELLCYLPLMVFEKMAKNLKSTELNGVLPDGQFRPKPYCIPDTEG